MPVPIPGRTDTGKTELHKSSFKQSTALRLSNNQRLCPSGNDQQSTKVRVHRTEREVHHKTIQWGLIGSLACDSRLEPKLRCIKQKSSHQLGSTNFLTGSQMLAEPREFLPAEFTTSLAISLHGDVVAHRKLIQLYFYWNLVCYNYVITQQLSCFIKEPYVLITIFKIVIPAHDMT